MRSFIKIFLGVLIGINVLFYLLTIKEGQDVLGKKDSWISNVLQSFEYYVKWVLPYWWFIIIIVALVLALVVLGVIKLLRRNK